MIATLSSVCSKALWILSDTDATHLIHSVEWNDHESNDLASQIAPKFEELLKGADLAPKELRALGVVTGPGAFTGLRVSSSFIQGLSRALRIPTIQISTFDLVEKTFQIPLQHQKYKNISLLDAAKNPIEVLQIRSATDFSVSAIDAQIDARGFRESELWPESAELLKALRFNLPSKSFDPINIQYGLNPKISGKRIES